MLIVETCGLASSVLITVMFVPQVVHTCRTKDTDGLSYAFLVTNPNPLATRLVTKNA